ncbi:MAG TPA: NapC/NirT family cytochrome c [Polyangiaceae bacterium]|nr:NapC/NirT family cytochrome c [Polyangiaceae bacterium]
MGHSATWLGIIALLAAAAAAFILLRFLIRKPALDFKQKLTLLIGLGVLPVVAAASSTVRGMEATTHRDFCGSCHVMTAHYENAVAPSSQSLSARHSRNPYFGEHSCYVCHADYGMLGYVLTKAGGLRHVYMYYLGGYRSMPLEEAKREIHLIKPYDNLNCRQCHTTTLEDWRKVPEHAALSSELHLDRIACASAGCHGYAHPFNKPAEPKPGEPPVGARAGETGRSPPRDGSPPNHLQTGKPSEPKHAP